jgi:hypothetical protein
LNVGSENSLIVFENADTENKIRVVFFGNSDVINWLHNIDRIPDLIEIK